MESLFNSRPEDFISLLKISDRQKSFGTKTTSFCPKELVAFNISQKKLQTS